MPYPINSTASTDSNISNMNVVNSLTKDPTEKAKNEFQSRLSAANSTGNTSNESLTDAVTNFLSKNISIGSPAGFLGSKFNINNSGDNILVVDLFALNKDISSSSGHTPFIAMNIKGQNYIGTYDGMQELAIGRALPAKVVGSGSNLISMGIEKLPPKIAEKVNKGPVIIFANIRETLNGRDVTSLTEAEIEMGKRKGGFKTSLNIGFIGIADSKEEKLDKRVKTANKGKDVPKKTVKAYTDILVSEKMKVAKRAIDNSKKVATVADIATSLNLATGTVKKIVKELIKEGLKEGTKEFSRELMKKLQKNIRNEVKQEVQKTFSAIAKPKHAYGFALKFDLPQLTDFQRQELKEMSGVPIDIDMAEGIVTTGKAVAEVVEDKVERTVKPVKKAVNDAVDTANKIGDAIDTSVKTYREVKRLIDDATNGIPKY